MKTFAEIERDFLRDKFLPNFEFEHFDEPSPVNPLRIPLQQASVSLVSTAGVYIKGTQAPFAMGDEGDASFREIPSDVQLSQLGLSHVGYDTRKALQDPNVVFPLDRLREAQQRGGIERIAQRHFSFMGYSPQVGQLMDNACQVANRLVADKVDLVLLVPA